AGFGWGNFGDGVIHRPRELHATIAADEALHRLRISTDQPPLEPRITFANSWPDGLSKPSHSLDIGVIFELAAEGDAMVLHDHGRLDKRQRIGINANLSMLRAPPVFL